MLAEIKCCKRLARIKCYDGRTALSHIQEMADDDIQCALDQYLEVILEYPGPVSVKAKATSTSPAGA